ncbi:MAG: hypothetical protein MZV70_71790 [Desulfobacterales bacterium]|nr:hypothetical protein [Desulfobacterales bacterium]
MRDLLSWIVPVFLFVGIWFFLMKRMQGQQPGFMSLGKNKAKIYMQDEVGVQLRATSPGWTSPSRSSWRSSNSSRSRSASPQIGGKMPRGVLLVGPRAPARPCSPRPWPAKAGCPSSA